MAETILHAISALSRKVAVFLQRIALRLPCSPSGAPVYLKMSSVDTESKSAVGVIPHPQPELDMQETSDILPDTSTLLVSFICYGVEIKTLVLCFLLIISF